MPKLVKQAELLAGKYSAATTNPPYLSGNMETQLIKYLRAKYSNGKNDLYAAMMERCVNFVEKCGYLSMITQHTWMFLSTYEKLRDELLEETNVINLVHLGPRAFEDISGEVVQTVAFTMINLPINSYTANFKRLISYNSTEKKRRRIF